MTEPSAFASVLRAELVAAARRKRDRRRRTVAGLAAAACALVAVAAVSVFGPTSDTAAAGVDVVVADGIATIRLIDLEHRPDLIEHEVRRVGLDVEVTAVPVGPSLVGRFVGDIRSAAEGLEPVGNDGDQSSAGFAIPVDWPGTLELQVGRPAAPGEAYAYASDAYAPGEPLSCQGLWGRTAEAAAQQLAELGVEASFQPVQDGVALPMLRPDQVATSAQRAWLLSEALAVAPDRVVLAITPDGRPPTAHPRNDDEGACHE